MTPLPARLVVLMYHGLHEGPRDDGHWDPRYSVAPSEFDAQMRRVRDKRGHAWMPDDGLASVRSPEIMVSFDDGEASDARIALPILQRLGLRAVFFVTSGFVGRRGSIDAMQLRELSDAGMAIGSHGASHRFLASLSGSELRAELVQSRDFLEACTGRRVAMLALPGGLVVTHRLDEDEAHEVASEAGAVVHANWRWRARRATRMCSVRRRATIASRRASCSASPSCAAPDRRRSTRSWPGVAPR